MRRWHQNGADVLHEEFLAPAIDRLGQLMRDHPEALEPVRKGGAGMDRVFADYGFRFVPTVMRTTLFHDEETRCFIKVLHALRMKEKIAPRSAKSIFDLAGRLERSGISVPRIVAHGRLGRGRPIYAMTRVPGRSLYDIMVRDGAVPPRTVLDQTADALAALHGAGYWLGDAHLSHVYCDAGNVTGFIDLDSIRRIGLQGMQKRAKDLAGFNHPSLPLGREEKRTFFDRYMQAAGFTDGEGLQGLVKRYTERRWKAQAS